MTVITYEPPALSSLRGAPAPPLEVGALRGPGQSAPVAALFAGGEVPAPWGPPDAPGACKQLYATAARHHADPFGVLELPSLWPASSRSRVRPRPLPFGPAYNVSDFEVFLNTTYVSLVRLLQPARHLLLARTPVKASALVPVGFFAQSRLLGTILILLSWRIWLGILEALARALHACYTAALDHMPAGTKLSLLSVCSPSAQNSTHFFSPPYPNSSFPPGPAYFVHTNFRIFGQVMYSMEILFTVRPTCMCA